MRLERVPVLLAGLAGAGVALAAASQGWARAEAGGLAVAKVSASGRDLVPGILAAVLVAAAAAAALALAGLWLTRALGVVLALAGAAIVWASLWVVAAPAARLRRHLEAGGEPLAELTQVGLSGVVWVCLCGGLLVVAAGLVALARAGTWRTTSRRFEPDALAVADGASPASSAAARDPRALWQALDRGEDPTAPTTPDQPGGTG